LRRAILCFKSIARGDRRSNEGGFRTLSAQVKDCVAVSNFQQQAPEWPSTSGFPSLLRRRPKALPEGPIARTVHRVPRHFQPQHEHLSAEEADERVAPMVLSGPDRSVADRNSVSTSRTSRRYGRLPPSRELHQTGNRKPKRGSVPIGYQISHSEPRR